MTRHDNDSGKTPLHVPCESGELEIVKFLLDNYIDVNVTDDSGQTPLHLACESGEFEIVKFLLDNFKKIDIL